MARRNCMPFRRANRAAKARVRTKANPKTMFRQRHARSVARLVFLRRLLVQDPPWLGGNEKTQRHEQGQRRQGQDPYQHPAAVEQRQEECEVLELQRSGVRKNENYRIKKVGGGLLGTNFSLFTEYNLQRLQSKQEESTEDEEMMQQQRMAVMKDLLKNIRSEGRMDVKNRWWVSELLAKDCEKAWTHPGWEDTMHNWYEWLEYMKKKEGKDGGDASAKGGEDDKECRRECWTSLQNHEANDAERRSADSEGGRKRREIVRSL